PREVFREAALGGAAAVVVFHNHPSGDPRPSPDDVELTERLAAAGGGMGIDVWDHIILGDVRYWRFKEMGQLPLNSPPFCFLFACGVAAQTRGPVDRANTEVPPGRRIPCGTDPLQYGELRVPTRALHERSAAAQRRPRLGRPTLKTILKTGTV